MCEVHALQHLNQSFTIQLFMLKCALPFYKLTPFLIQFYFGRGKAVLILCKNANVTVRSLPFVTGTFEMRQFAQQNVNKKYSFRIK